MIIKKAFSFLVLIFLTGLSSCEQDYYDEPIPQFPVDFEINVNDPQYHSLHTLGYTYVDGKGRGVRGIILYKNSNQHYTAFERTCSFQPTSACATVDVHPSGQYMADSCCGSIFNWQGNPIGAPAYLPLLKYETSLNGSYLRIFNHL
jgi:hypothetical protein